ncbi:MAG: hydrogenase maturation nickel metallochaperone HypA [Bacteroidales bacterium]
MHEFSIAKNIVSIAEDYARRERKHRVLRVNLEIGELSGVILDAMNYALETCTQNTLLEKAEFDIEHVKASGQCLDCGKVFPLEGPVSPCPGCGSYRFEFKSGRELRIKSLIVES